MLGAYFRKIAAKAQRVYMKLVVLGPNPTGGYFQNSGQEECAELSRVALPQQTSKKSEWLRHRLGV